MAYALLCHDTKKYICHMPWHNPIPPFATPFSDLVPGTKKEGLGEMFDVLPTSRIQATSVKYLN